MRTSFAIVLMILLSPTIGLSTYGEPDLNDDEISKRIEQMENKVVSPRYDKIVRSYIRTYTILDREKAERILGHQIMYFPIFEAYLRKYQLPEDLKYLPVVESGLQPKALSRAGARGLWQFMPPTGAYFGLTINENLDERCDPHAATEAAMKYLSHLYNRFDNWELAIAAYNSGGGRVSRAIKRARSTNFWTVKNYLPRETANYVPAFIAASYLMHYYEAHNLEPQYPSLDAQLTDRIKVHRRLTFYEIAQVTGLPLNLIEHLNPAYEKLYIPANGEGLPLVLPKRKMPDLTAYLRRLDQDDRYRAQIQAQPVFESRPQDELDRAYVPMRYTLAPGQTLGQLAVSLDCTTQQLLIWNKLTPQEVRPGMEVIAYRPVEEKIAQERAGFWAAEPLDLRTLHTVDHRATNIYEEKINRFLTQGEWLFFWVEERMTVGELALLLPGISAADLLTFNALPSTLSILKPDDKIKIKRR